MLRILQWNLNGLLNNYADLNILIKEFYPDIIALQETHLPHNNTAHPPNKYTGYYHNCSQIVTHKQGIAVFIKKTMTHKQVPIVSSISCLAVEVDIGYKLTIVNCYIPPHQNFTTRELTNILNIFHTPIILLGDFNAWSPLWGSPSTNTRGQIIEDIILSHNLIVLNDGSPTHFSTHKTFSHPDIILSSASIAPKLSSRTLDELHNSDHFPLITSISHPGWSQIKPKSKFLTDKADWSEFRSIATSLSNNSPRLKILMLKPRR